MLETFSSVSSSSYIHAAISRVHEEICCPIPRRPSSPAFVPLASSKKRKTTVSSKNDNDESDWEATQELQEILFSQLPCDYGYSDTEECESDTEVTDSTSNASTNSLVSHERPFDPTRSPVKENLTSTNFLREVMIDSLLSDKSGEDFSSVYRKRGPKSQRPKLGNSTTSLTVAGLVSEPVITPPDRVHNPLPLNIAFCHRKDSEGTEFGLLSVSPPRFEDEDVLIRRARVKSKKKDPALEEKSLPLKRDTRLVYLNPHHVTDLFF